MSVIRQSIKMALQNIKANKMRSFLTMLGIVIGVAAVIALMTIVQMVSESVMGQMSGLGAGTLTIATGKSPLKEGLSDKDIKMLDEIEGVDGVSPTLSFSSTSVYDGEVYDKTDVQGKTDLYFKHNPDIMGGGRPLNEMDMSGDVYVCIVDPQYVRKVLLGKKVIGNKILIGGYEYTIVGVRKADESISSYMSDTSNHDGTVIIPYKNALAMSGKGFVDNAEVYIEEGYNANDVESALRQGLKNIYNGSEDFFYIINMESLMTMMASVQGMMGTLLGGIASISLVVGGIGIMNMMLTTVTERTKEIGLRKALGAEPYRIQAQFLIESVVLSVCGGIIGIVLGLLIAFVSAKLLKTDFSLSMTAILLGFGFSGGVGVVFGWMPAKRASELNPIDALRAD
ncbi:MAG: ABC transporter permease [Lachnospiraceae bacterium]|nr:ABC transporter permease [Lachnospiraceae bacterium]